MDHKLLFIEVALKTVTQGTNTVTKMAQCERRKEEFFATWGFPLQKAENVKYILEKL